MSQVTLPSRVVDYCIVVGAQISTRSSLTTPSSPLFPTTAASPAISSTSSSLPVTSALTSSSSTLTPPTIKQLQPGEIAPIRSHRPHPAILQRYPVSDHSDAVCPQDISMFAFPSLTFDLSARKMEREVYSVVLTEANGARVYVSCMRWWEKADDSMVKAVLGAAAARERRGTLGKIADDGALVPVPSSASPAAPAIVERIMFAPKCVLLTSHWPFFTQMENFLTSLYAFITPSSPTLPFPIERALQNLIVETPLPPPGQLQVECHPLPSLVLLFSRPPPNALPLHDFSTLYLFRLLSPDNVLTVFSAVSVEKRVLFISSHLHRLTLSAESLLSFLFPFFWRNIYIPLLPQQLLEFTCAPMPYIMGCPTQYKPETELLDGVLVVDLDSNTVTWNGNAEERPPPLPPARSVPLLKSLKRLFGDTSVPLRTGQVVDEEEVHGVFVRFFARLLSSYRDFLLPPSEYSPDKFDRVGFLGGHEDRGSVYLVELLDTQMFGSFIDDRYEDGSTSSSVGKDDQLVVDVLIFDEWIDREMNRPTPFLSDTSHDHHSNKRYQVPLPYADDLDSNQYHYTTFPDLTPALLCPQPRLPPLLSQPSVSQHATPASLSMKFFTEKRLYSQYFHTLRLRSSKHDLLLKDVTAWCRESARLEEERYKGMAELCRTTVLKESVETGTSLDVAWSTLRAFVNEQSGMEEDMFRVVREESFIPLSTAASACEHQLRLLFSEASVLEGKAAKLKSAFERSKAKAKALEHKYVQQKNSLFASTLQQATSGAFPPQLTPGLSAASLLNGLGASPQLSSSSLLPTQQLYALIALRSEQEEAMLEQDEDEESFTSIVHEYEERMPEIVESIKLINRERLDVFKQSVKRWCDSRRGWLQQMTANLDGLEDSVHQMDVDRDMKVLTEGAADFNKLMSVTTGAGDLGAPPTDSASTSGKSDGVREHKEQQKEAVRALAANDALHGRATPTSRQTNGLPPQHGKHASMDSNSSSHSHSNPLSRPASPIAVDGQLDLARVTDSDDRSPRPSLTITTTSPPPESSGRKAAEERKEASGPGSLVSTTASSPSNGKKRNFLVSTIDVPSPTSAPHAPQVVKRAGERGRSLSSASASQPSSPAAASPAPSNSPLPHAVPPHRTSAPGSLATTPSLRQGSSPRLHALHSSGSLSQLSSSHLASSSNLASTFLSAIKKQHMSEDRRDAARQARRARENAEWKEITATSLNDLTPSYALNLWGDSGFDIACQQGTANKRALKEMTMELEQWTLAMEAKKKRWEAILLMLPKTVGSGGGQAKVWELMRQRVSLHARAYADYLSTVYRCVTDLKLDKGELKFSVKRYVEHKARLERELAAASEAVAKALQKRTRASQALQLVEAQQKGLEQVQMTQKQLESNAAVVDRAIRDFKEAEHEWAVSERDRVACQRKHDGCVARMLLLLERKDTQTGLGIKRVLNVLADNYVVQYIHAIRRGDDQLMQTVRSVDLNRDLTDFLQSTYDSITPAAVKVKPGERVDFSTHLRFMGSNAFAVVDNLVLRSIDALRVLIDLMVQLAETEEADARGLKKVISPVRSMTNTSVQLALTSFDVWLERQVEVGEEQGRVLRGLTDSLTKMKSAMKTAEKAKERTFQDVEKSWKRLQDERDRAVNDERKAEDAFALAKQRVERAMAEGTGPSNPPAQKGFFSSLTASSLDSLKNKQHAAEADLRVARSFTASKEKPMAEERVRREAAMASVLREMQALEERKWACVAAFYASYMERHRAFIEKVSLHVNTFRQQIKGMDVHLDLMDFLARHNGGAPPPLVVLESELKRKEDTEREEREKEEERKRREQAEERSRTGRSRRSRLSPSRSVRRLGDASDPDHSNATSSIKDVTPSDLSEGPEHVERTGTTSSRRPLPPPPASAAGQPAGLDPRAAAEGTKTPLSSDGLSVAVSGAVSPEVSRRVSPSSSTTSEHSPLSTASSPPLSPNSLPVLTSAGPFPPPRPPRPRILSPRHSTEQSGHHPPAIPPHPAHAHDAAGHSPISVLAAGAADAVPASSLSSHSLTSVPEPSPAPTPATANSSLLLAAAAVTSLSANAASTPAPHSGPSAPSEAAASSASIPCPSETVPVTAKPPTTFQSIVFVDGPLSSVTSSGSNITISSAQGDAIAAGAQAKSEASERQAAQAAAGSELHEPGAAAQVAGSVQSNPPDTP